MSRTINAAVSTELNSDHVTAAILGRFDYLDRTQSTPVVTASSRQLFTTAGQNITWNSSDGGDSDSYGEYVAMGNFVTFSRVEESVELQTYSIDVGLSGIPVDAVIETFANTDFLTKQQHQPAYFYLAVMDSNYELVGEPLLIFEGEMDIPVVDIGESASITMTINSHLMDWERPRGGRFNHNDQRRIDPNDRGFEHLIAGMEKELQWGAATTNTGGGGGGAGGLLFRASTHRSFRLPFRYAKM